MSDRSSRKRNSLDDSTREKRHKPEDASAPKDEPQARPEKRRREEAQVSTEQTVHNGTSRDHEPVRVYADGIYDLFHFGHARSLEQAKKLFPNTYLIVGVCNDELTHRLKGRTVMTDKERAESLRHCKWVDEVVEDAPWIVTQDFIDVHQIHYVAHGEDIILDENGDDIYKFVKDKGKYKTIKRTDGISTSDIILRIVKDYDSYVRRNLARGYTGKQMNVGFVKEKQIQMEENIKKFKAKIQDRMNKMQSWSKSHRIMEFLRKFGGSLERRLSLDEGAEYDSDDLGLASPETNMFSSPEQQESPEEEEEPPHV